MANTNRDGLFKPNLTKTESKAETVSRVARNMIDQEIAKRDAKTARLREARMARDAAVPVPPAKPERKAGARGAK